MKRPGGKGPVSHFSDMSVLLQAVGGILEANLVTRPLQRSCFALNPLTIMFRVATTMLSASAARMSSRASRCVTVATPRFFSASIISGTKIAQTVVTEVAEAVSTHAAECGRAPGLATVLVRRHCGPWMGQGLV